MTLFFSRNKKIERAITFLLLIFFNLSSLACAAEPVLCIDQEESHVLAQEQFYLEACHVVNGTMQPKNDPSLDTCLTSGKNQERSCFDISLNSSDVSISSHQVKDLSSKRKLGTWFIAHPSLLARQTIKVAVKPDLQAFPSTSPLVSLQNIVLLI